MPNLLLDPITAVAVLLLAGAALVFGRLRREPWWAIALTAVGATAFLLGLRWAGSLGQEAFAAAALTSGGMAVWAEVAARGRSGRKPRPAESGS